MGEADEVHGPDNLDPPYRIRVLDRVLKFPSVHYLWDKSVRAYGRVKGANVVLEQALDTVENILSSVMEKSLSLPVMRIMEKPIYTLDRTLCLGLDFIEVNLPIVKEDPSRILDRARLIVSERISPAMRTFNDLKHETRYYVRFMKVCTCYNVHCWRLYGWEQADRVMSTETGIIILKTVDSTTHRVESLLDKYLAPPQDDDYYDFGEHRFDEECSERDNLHHTILRLSEFSARASRRIYMAAMESMEHMYKIEILVLILHALIVIQVVKLLEILLTFVLKSLY